MKKENGLGVTGVIILICVVIIAITAIALFIANTIKNEKVNSIVSNILQVQGACKVVNDNVFISKTTDSLVGTKLSLYVDELNQEESQQEKKVDNIITEFKKLNIIPEEEYEKYYVLTDQNLETLNLNIKNEKDSYYIVNYEKDDLIITKGYKGKYRLSDIEQEINKKKEKEEVNNQNEKSGEEETQEQKSEQKEETEEQKSE